MLLLHHENRVHKIKQLKQIETRIYEAEMLISRYHESCYDLKRYLNQYEVDLLAIREIIGQRKRIYDELPLYEKERLNLGLTAGAYEIFMKSKGYR